jgi:uncharacterized protein YyaL (SSP411 family)
MRDMRDKDGGFYSAEDADSVPAAGGPKKEGAFYVWTAAEIDALLGEDADVVRARFGIEPDGNAPDDPHGEFTGQNILYTSQSIEDITARTGKDADAIVAALGRARRAMFDTREGRPRPYLDDKVLTSWNGMMIAAFARAARALPDRPQAGEWLAVAQRAAGFVRARLWDDATRTLRRRYRDGDASIDAYAEDYACLIWGLLALFQADGDAGWLAWARTLQARQDELFWDEQEGGWFSTTGQDPTVLLRLKEDYDGAEPSASSVSVHNLLTLSYLSDDAGARGKAERTLGRYGARAGRAARVIPMMMAALSAWHGESTQIVLVGEAEGRLPLARVVASHYLPFAIEIPVAPSHQQEVAAALPFVAAMSARDGATAYVCRDFTCRAPVTTAEALEAELRAS